MNPRDIEDSKREYETALSLSGERAQRILQLLLTNMEQYADDMAVSADTIKLSSISAVNERGETEGVFMVHGHPVVVSVQPLPYNTCRISVGREGWEEKDTGKADDISAVIGRIYRGVLEHFESAKARLTE